MTEFEKRGNELRKHAKEIVLDFMKNTSECIPGGVGIKQSGIFHACGFSWGDYPNATSSNQQYWLVALLRELETEGKVERVERSGPWRLL